MIHRYGLYVLAGTLAGAFIVMLLLWLALHAADPSLVDRLRDVG